MRAVAQIAQSVEQGIENPRVGGSIPSLGTNNSSLVQSVERRTVNPYVTGSSPVRGAIFKKPAWETKQVFCFFGRYKIPSDKHPACSAPRDMPHHNVD